MTTKFKIALASVIALASGSFWFAYANQSKMEVDVSDVTLENIEAFSSTQSLDCEYKRLKNSCTIEFNGNIEIELFEHAVITTKGDGYIINSSVKTS